jgi:hypothetical protein
MSWFHRPMRSFSLSQRDATWDVAAIGFFMSGLLKWFRDSHPRALARPCLPKLLADRGAGCKEKQSRVSSIITFLTAYSEICGAKFSKID